MNATATAPAATTYVPVTVGSGKAVHLGTDRGDGYGPSVDCGAVRYRNITTRSITRQAAGTEVTCTKCLAKAPVAPLEVVTLDGEELTVEVTATEGTHTFTASPADSRRCTCGKSRNVKAHGYTPSRGAGRAAAEKLTAAETKQEQAAATVQAAEDAVAAVYANFAAKKEAAQEVATSEERTALDTLLGRPTAKRSLEELAATEAPAERKVERVALGTVKERKPAAKAVKVKAPKEEAPAPTSQIGKGVVRFTLTTEAAGTVAYTSGSQINRDYALALAEGRPAVLRTIKGHIIRQH